MSRNPRSTTPCRPPPARSANPGGETTAAVAQPACRARPKKSAVQSTIPKRGPPPAPPKKLDYKKPTMTKAMAQRLKHTQKLQEEIARKEAERARKGRRSAPPPAGGRERRSGDKCRPTSAKEPPPCPASSTHAEPTQRSGGSCPRAASPCPRERSPAPVPTRTRNLAESMNADIVQAEPLRPGPVDNLIIPPGAINSEKTTIVSIPQPEPAQLVSSTMAPAGSGQVANRSVQVIAETLDEQDAAESAVVNTKLQDLQQARRDFVMAVANVGGNAISLQDEEEVPGLSLPNLPNVTPITEITPPMLSTPGPPSPRLVQCPSLSDPYLQVEYGRDHPVVEAAREYMRNRAAGKRLEDEFQRLAGEQPEEDFEQEYLEGCGIVGAENEDEICAPAYTAIPRRQQQYRYDPLEIDRLERFFDVQNYPPAPPTPPPAAPTGPPPGRECLPQELWDLDDPWYHEPSQPDLIQW
ncbi:hypothetical protein TSAR_015180 [Trichomalopsis sarcophagae]|uniref:Uncharacterized protein n=1 Tax=Trichomalopsis sarcophagae TaxID=543379 RepID=A0A232FEE2_9HYME|nr:hypothetical protein TSAR_015180 [Trichomalopsis sarcophagae]